MSCSLEEHKMHLCAMQSQDNQECIRSLTDKPTVECVNCGALANDPQNVCEPKPLPHIRAAAA